MRIRTGDAAIDSACELAVRTLKMNVSEKWGKLCPVVAPAWGAHYPAWIHPFDNFWMGKVTPYLYPRDQVEWPVVLFSKYQHPSGMIAYGVHDCPSPEATQARYAELDPEELKQYSINSRYIRDHLYIMQVFDLWWHYGDSELARELFASCTRALEYLYSLKDSDGDGLVESADIIEDVDIGSHTERTGPNAVERSIDQVLLYGALVHYAKLADALNESAEAEKSRTRAAELAKKINTLYWSENGYYIFAVDAKTHESVHGEVTSTYGNGYGILWNLVPAEWVDRMLDYLTSWDIEVPGPILLPPLDIPTSTASGNQAFPPGVYANGGCGWGRGHMPSVCLALFKHNRKTKAIDYLKGMAKAANDAGAFYEYWTWAKYTGETKPGGCKDYSETASAYLDSIIHGYFGLSALEPAWKSLRFAPRPIEGAQCSITLNLPGGSFSAQLERTEEGMLVRLESETERNVEIDIEGAPPIRISVIGEARIMI